MAQPDDRRRNPDPPAERARTERARAERERGGGSGVATAGRTRTRGGVLRDRRPRYLPDRDRRRRARAPRRRPGEGVGAGAVIVGIIVLVGLGLLLWWFLSQGYDDATTTETDIPSPVAVVSTMDIRDGGSFTLPDGARFLVIGERQAAALSARGHRIDALTPTWASAPS